MKELLNKIKAQISLKGTLGQFNVMILIFAVLIIFFAYVFLSISDKRVSYLGLLILSILVGFIMFSGVKFFMRQEIRPTDGPPSAITVETPGGTKINIKNPPDKLFFADYKNTLLRGMLVSYDSNLCPDGEVIGKASEEKYRWYTAAEKEAFKEKHESEIKGKKQEVVGLISDDKEDKDSEIILNKSTTI